MGRHRALSPHARALLAVLLEANGGWSHGYELARLADVKSGTLYPLLIRLEAGGFLEAEWQHATDRGGPPRHAYRLTASGIALAHANPPAPAAVSASRPRQATV